MTESAEEKELRIETAIAQVAVRALLDKLWEKVNTKLEEPDETHETWGDIGSVYDLMDYAESFLKEQEK